eukprot:Awhi_evm1s8708
MSNIYLLSACHQFSGLINAIPIQASSPLAVCVDIIQNPQFYYDKRIIPEFVHEGIVDEVITAEDLLKDFERSSFGNGLTGNKMKIALLDA